MTIARSAAVTLSAERPSPSTRARARPSPSTVLAYVLFFPHLIAGPILRPHELIPQLDAPRKARVLFPTAAITIFTIGLV